MSVRSKLLTYSMGGTVLRVIKSTHPDFAVARVVMLGPPNHESEIVDELGGLETVRSVEWTGCSTPWSRWDSHRTSQR